MSAEKHEERQNGAPKVPALPTGMSAVPPPAPLTRGRMPSLSSLISQGGPGKRGYARTVTGAGTPDAERVPSVPVPGAAPEHPPGFPAAPTSNGENYSTLQEALSAEASGNGSVVNMPPPPARPSDAVPSLTRGISGASRREDLDHLYQEASGEQVSFSAPASPASPPPSAVPALPPSMPAPPPARKAPPASSAPLNAEEIPVSVLDPAQILKPSRRSIQSPYRGLQRFDVEDSEHYYGPRQLLVDVLDALDETSLLCVTGPPACGKSSLLRAGVIPNWRELEGESTRAIVFSPGDDPFTELSHALLAADCPPEMVAIAREPAHYVFQRLEAALEPEEKWLILVDQFEEAARGMQGDEVPRDAAFMASLVEVAGRPESRIKLVLALRDDFFWKLGHYPALAREVDNHLYRLMDLTPKEIQSAVTMPAREHGVEIEPALLRHILQDLPDQRPSLPLMQHVLDVLWIARGPDQMELRLDDYLVLGGLSGALRRRLETIYAGLSAAGKIALRQALLRLVDVSGMTVGSRGPGLVLPYRMALEDFGEIREREAVEMLIAARLLMCRQGPRTIVELPVAVYLKAWPRFQRWLQEINEAVALRNQISEDAARWKFNVNRKGDAVAAKDLWKGGHLEWALELKQRGDFDSLIGGLTRDEEAFLEASELAGPAFISHPAPVAPAPPPPIPPSPGPALSSSEISEASAELAGVLNKETDSAQRAVMGAGPESPAVGSKSVGGPSLKQKVEDADLRSEVQTMELQHELIVRERLIKLLKMIIGGLVILVVILALLTLKGCSESAGRNAWNAPALEQYCLHKVLIVWEGRRPGDIPAQAVDRAVFPRGKAWEQVQNEQKG